MKPARILGAFIFVVLLATAVKAPHNTNPDRHPRPVVTKTVAPLKTPKPTPTPRR